MNSGGRRNHLFIAGTGRAGTSFLVQYLHALGLDTHLSRHADPSWSQSANAGLEDLPLTSGKDDLPYVVKSPWLGEIIDQVLSGGVLIRKHHAGLHSFLNMRRIEARRRKASAF